MKMSLPDLFSSTHDYLDAAIQFLSDYKWIYCNRNTDILTRNILTNFSEDWSKHLNSLSVNDLHDLVIGHVREDAPQSLKLFISKINDLKPPSNYDPVRSIDRYSINGLNNKKVHEITILAPVIKEICNVNGCNLIVDIGSGLGYLPHILYEKYGSSVLGLEASKKFLELAQANQEKLHPRSKNSVKFFEMFVDNNSATEIEKLMEDHFGESNDICITGLHACADLSIEVLDLFIKLKRAKSLVIMPCCYHRIKVENEDTSTTRFKNFPASRLLTALFDKYDGYSFLRQPFLRLACQQTLASFTSMSQEEHSHRSSQCLYRAILQLVAENEHCSVRRLKRKSGKSNAIDSDEGFQTYLNNLKYTHKLENTGPSENSHIQVTDEAFLTQMHEKWQEYKSDCWLVEVLMGLQAAIQSICENVILLDRVEFLTEKGFRCYNRKITNDLISPRCWAIIANKNQCNF